MRQRGTYSKGKERREEILRVAFDVLRRDGYAGTTLAQIGRAIGLDSAHIVYYFPSREALLQELLVSWDEDNFATFEQGDDVFAWWVDTVRQNMRNPGMVQLYTAFAAEAVDEEHPARDFFQKRFAALQRFIADEIRRRQALGLANSGFDADDLAQMLIAQSDGLQVRWLLDRSIDMAASLQLAMDTLINLREWV
jgi:AcrR family transcriptional regulator